MSEIELLLRKLAREQRARREAEVLLESKSRESFLLNEELQRLNELLEEQVQRQTDDLTEAERLSQVNREERLHAEQRFRATIESAPVAMVMIDSDGKIVLVNSETEKLFGYARDEILGRPVETLIPERFREQHPRLRDEYFVSPESRRMGVGRNLSGLHKSGDEFPVEIGLNPVVTDEGVFILSAIADITERQRTQAVLDEMRRELVDLAENANVPMHWVDSDGVIEWANQAELDLLGYAREEYIGQPVAKFHADSAVIQDILNRLSNYEDLAGYEARLLTKSGMVKTVSIHSSVYIRDGKFKHTRCFSRDISEQKRAEAQLARQAREATLLHRVTTFAAAADCFEGALQDALDAICETVQWPVGHVFWPAGNGSSKLVSAGIWHLPEDICFESFRVATENISFESGVGLPGRVLASGSPAWIADVGADSNYPRNQVLADLPVRGAFAFPVVLRGDTLAVLEFYHTETIALDENLLAVSAHIGIQLGLAVERINARRKLEEHATQLERSNRELQEFAYVASHDLKSPLRAILHLAQWVVEDEENRLSSQSLEDLEALQKRSAGMSRLLDDLLAYSRIGRKSYEVVEIDTGELTKEIVESLDKPAQFSVTVAEGMPTLSAHLVPLRMVLQNLIENAIKHHDRPDGRVEVSGHECARHVEFKIRDDGPGIPEEAVGKVFDLFFALGSNDRGESSGMGLALVRKTVESHGGSVRIETPADGDGAVFCVSWPNEPWES